MKESISLALLATLSLFSLLSSGLCLSLKDRFEKHFHIHVDFCSAGRQEHFYIASNRKL